MIGARNVSDRNQSGWIGITADRDVLRPCAWTTLESQLNDDGIGGTVVGGGPRRCLQIPMRIQLTLRNTSDEPVSFNLGGRPPHDFMVATADGEEVWHWSCARFRLLPSDRETLEPGETLEFMGEWEQVYNRGKQSPGHLPSAWYIGFGAS